MELWQNIKKHGGTNMEKEKIKKSEFTGKCIDLAETITRKAHNLREEAHLGYQHWYFRNGALAMAQELLLEKYQVVED